MFAEVENAMPCTGPRSSAVTSVYNHAILALMPRSLCARVLGGCCSRRVSLHWGWGCWAPGRGLGAGGKTACPWPSCPTGPSQTTSNVGTAGHGIWSFFTTHNNQNLHNMFFAILQIKHSSICKKYTHITSKSLHLHIPYNLVLNPLCIFSKCSHCLQFSNQVDKENMVGRPPKSSYKQ